MTNLVKDERAEDLLEWMRGRLSELLAEAHDEFLPGNAYIEWVDRERNIIKTGLGPVAE